MVLNPRTVAVIKIDMYLFLWRLQSVGGHRQCMRRNHRSDRGATAGMGGSDAFGNNKAKALQPKHPEAHIHPVVPVTSPRHWILSPLSGLAASALAPFTQTQYIFHTSWNLNFS